MRASSLAGGGGCAHGLGQRQRNHAAAAARGLWRRASRSGLALQQSRGGLRGRCEERGRTEEGREHGFPHPAILVRGRAIASFRCLAAGNPPRPARAEDLRHLLRARLPGLRPPDRAPPARARQAARLVLRVRLRRTGGRSRRLAGRLPGPELGQRLRRPARQRLLGLGPGLVRRLRRRRARRDPVGALARLARLALFDTAAVPLARGLRDRAGRLPALGRRRLRQPVGPALGDGLPRRHRADHRRGAPDARLRDARDGGRGAAPVESARPRAPGVLFGLYLVLAGIERLPCRVHPPQRRRRRGPHPAAADQPCDDRGRRGMLATRRAAPPRRRRPERASDGAAAAHERERHASAPRRAVPAWNETQMPTIPAPRADGRAGPDRSGGRARVAAHRQRGRRSAPRAPAGRRAPGPPRPPPRRAAPAGRARINDGRQARRRRARGLERDGRQRAVEAAQRGAPPSASSAAAATRSPSLTPSGSPNRSSPSRWGESGASASSAPRPTQPGHRHGRCRVRADAGVAGGEARSARRPRARRPRRRAAAAPRRARRARAPAAARGRATRRRSSAAR